MSKKIDTLLKKLESEKNQINIKKFNMALSLFAIFFIARLFNEFNSESFKLSIKLIFAIFIQLSFLYILYKIWKNFIISNSIETNTSILENWSQANINKYIPGGISLTVTRFSIAKNLSKDSKKLFFGMIEDQLKGAFLVFPFLILTLFFETELQKIYLFCFSFVFSLYLISNISEQYASKFKFKSLFHKNLLLILLSNLIQILVNFLILSSLLDIKNIEIVYISILYCVSASLSLIFIGSPAGLGIREIIFYIYSSNLLSNEIMLSYLILIRIISAVTDVAFYLLCKLSLKLN